MDSTMSDKYVTDPALLQQLNAPSKQYVNDPALLAELNGELNYPKLNAQQIQDNALRQRLQGEGVLSRNLEGAMTAPSNLIEGVKQGAYELLNAKNPLDVSTRGVPQQGYDTTKIRQNRVIASEAPVGALAGNVATALPLAFLPGGSRMAGQTAYGTMLAAAEPTMGDESRVSNMAVGGLTGLAVPTGVKIASALRQDPASLAKQQAVNATKDATTLEALKAGFTIPRSMYNASFLTNRLESISGKAATKQQAGAENQKITNDLTRKYLGVSEDTPLSPDLLEQLRTAHAAPYRDASALPAGQVGTTSTKSLATGGTTQSPIIKTGEQLVDELKIAREDARAAWKASKMSEKPAQARQQAEQLDSNVATLENQLDELAKLHNQPDLVQRLNQARQNIAKVHTIDKAMNDATGEINAQELLKLQNKNTPLTGEAKQIADFASAYPEISKPGAKIPTAGVSKSEALAALLLGGVGHAATGNFMGTLLSTLPLLSHPARAAALSKTLQKMPNYNEGMVSKALNQLSKLPLSEDQVKKYGFALSQGLQNTNQGEQ
jgi:ribosomal protein L29